MEKQHDKEWLNLYQVFYKRKVATYQTITDSNGNEVKVPSPDGRTLKDAESQSQAIDLVFKELEMNEPGVYDKPHEAVLIEPDLSNVATDKAIEVPGFIDSVWHIFEGLVPGATEKQFYAHRLEMQFARKYVADKLPEKQFIAEEKQLTTKLLRLLPNTDKDLIGRIRAYRQYLDLRLADLNQVQSEKRRQPKLTVDEVALKCHYEGRVIKRGDEAEKIARSFGHRSGDKLYLRYNHWSKKINRTGDPESPGKLKSTIKHIEKVIPTLPQDKKKAAQNDLKSLETIQEGSKS